MIRILLNNVTFEKSLRVCVLAVASTAVGVRASLPHETQPGHVGHQHQFSIFTHGLQFFTSLFAL